MMCLASWSLVMVRSCSRWGGPIGLVAAYQCAPLLTVNSHVCACGGGSFGRVSQRTLFSITTACSSANSSSLSAVFANDRSRPSRCAVEVESACGALVHAETWPRSSSSLAASKNPSPSYASYPSCISPCMAVNMAIGLVGSSVTILLVGLFTLTQCFAPSDTLHVNPFCT